MDGLENLSPSERIHMLQEMKKKQQKDIESLIEKAQEENKESEAEGKQRIQKEKEDVEKVNEDEDIEQIVQKEKQDEEIKHQASYAILNEEKQQTYLADESNKQSDPTQVYQAQEAQQTYSRGGEQPTQHTYQTPGAQKEEEKKYF